MTRPVILIVNGPNLNLLGYREPHLYGTATLIDAENLARSRAGDRGLSIDFFQSNSEGDIIGKVHEAYGTCAGIIVNPGGLTSTSIALLDALLGVDLPTVEVHVTNIHQRESFRHTSYVSQAAIAVFAGAGIAGYGFAIEILADRLASASGTDRFWASALS